MLDQTRYSRQMLFQLIGKKGQEKLLNSRVAIVGMGALGTVIANHFVRSGIGYVRMIDRDVVELSNLHRQTLYDEEDARRVLPKVIAAKNRLEQINSTIELDARIADLTGENAEELLRDVDLIMDGTDNFLTRYIINDVAMKYQIPWIHGGAVGSRGMFAVFKPRKTPCYRCLFPEAPIGLGDTCDTIGVLGPLTDIIGSYQAIEAFKVLTDADSHPYLEQLDIWKHEELQLNIRDGRSEKCPACVGKQYDFLEEAIGNPVVITSLCGRDTVQIRPRQKRTVDLSNLAEKLKESGDVKGNAYVLRLSLAEGIQMVYFTDGRVLIHGTNDPVQAKIYYSHYAGL